MKMNGYNSLAERCYEICSFLQNNQENQEEFWIHFFLILRGF